MKCNDFLRYMQCLNKIISRPVAQRNYSRKSIAAGSLLGFIKLQAREGLINCSFARLLRAIKPRLQGPSTAVKHVWHWTLNGGCLVVLRTRELKRNLPGKWTRAPFFPDGQVEVGSSEGNVSGSKVNLEEDTPEWLLGRQRSRRATTYPNKGKRKLDLSRTHWFSVSTTTRVQYETF